MKILIVENELYLAQSIATKLSEVGHLCEIAINTKEAIKDEKYDAVLLSTNVSGQNFYPVIEKYVNSIIILMITYISNDTISNPIKAGADDYIQKPFMIEELIRKLEHLKKYNDLLEENRTLSSYVKNFFEKIELTQDINKRVTSPLLIKCSKQNVIDSTVFKYSKAFKDLFEFISLNDSDYFEKIQRCENAKLIYLTQFQDLKKSEQEKITELVKSKRVIISSTNMYEKFPYTILNIALNDNFFGRSDILSIDDYIKHVLTHFQDSTPDTELSKKLGISRKNLWERRRKYGMQKK